MPSYNVIIQPEAEQDLDEAYEFLETQRTGLGMDLLVAVTEIIEILEENPLLFQKVHGEKRRAVVRGLKYNLIYIVKSSDVYILAIIHGSRDPRGWQRRSLS